MLQFWCVMPLCSFCWREVKGFPKQSKKSSSHSILNWSGNTSAHLSLLSGSRLKLLHSSFLIGFIACKVYVDLYWFQIDLLTLLYCGLLMLALYGLEATLSINLMEMRTRTFNRTGSVFEGLRGGARGESLHPGSKLGEEWIDWLFKSLLWEEQLTISEIR